MSVRRTIGLIVLTNIVFVAVAVGILYLTGVAAAGPALQGSKPQPPDVNQFPLYQTAEDLQGAVLPPLPGAPNVPGVFYQSFAGVTFTPRSTGGVKTLAADAQCLYADESTTNPVSDPVVVPVQMPQGSVINNIVLFYYRGGATENPSLELKRSNMLGTVDTLAQAVATSATGYQFITRTLTTTVTVNNATYAYFLTARLNHKGSGIRLCGARIGYTTTAGAAALTPLVTKNSPYP